MDFKEICESINDTACIVSVRKTKDGFDEIRIVDGNEKYLASFDDRYKNNSFVPNMIYTHYIKRNLNFEEYSYRSAVKKELLHSYAFAEFLQSWLHMIFIPINYEDGDLSYCLYIMNISTSFVSENLATTTNDMQTKVLNAALKLANTDDFKLSLKGVTREIRKICNASFCCILLVDDLKKELEILAEDRELNTSVKHLIDYNDESFSELVKSWNKTIGDSNCIIISDENGMNYLKETNFEWYQSLQKNNINSLVLFRLKSNNKQIGYMWISGYKVDDTPKIKETLEITTFILGSQIGNYLLVKQLTVLSSVDLLTGLYNRNKFNNYIGDISAKTESIALIFLDINGLKTVNDKYGHLEGDKLIIKASETLKTVFKGNDIFRVGGDEFVVILKNVNGEQIHQSLEKLDEISAKNNVSFAVGYSMTNDSKNIEKILKEADYNMYENKKKYYKSNQ